MCTNAALTTITGNPEVFGVEQLFQVEPAKIKTLKLPGKFAYFQGASNYHRVAVTYPLEETAGSVQQLAAGLLWANKVSNGQKTVLYLVSETFGFELSRLSPMFGPQIEIRLAYFTPKLSNPFLLVAKDSLTPVPRFLPPQLPGLKDWQRKFNPVEKGWFLTALDCFAGYSDQGVEISFQDNWVSITVKGLELVRITKKGSHLRITLTTRYPREVEGFTGKKEEKEGWFNAHGRPNSEFVTAFEERLQTLKQEHELFARVQPEKQRLLYQLAGGLPGFSNKICQNICAGFNEQASLWLDAGGVDPEGIFQVLTVHTQRDYFGIIHTLEQMVWTEIQLPVINNLYFPEQKITGSSGYLLCAQDRLHPDVELIRTLMYEAKRPKLLLINSDWEQTGLRLIKALD